MASSDPQRDENDFALILDFTPGDTHPTRIFKTAIALINEFADFDRELVKSLNPDYSSSLQLEQVEEGSLKVWLRSALHSVDDDALKSGDWKKVVGNWLYLGKQQLLKYLDDEHSTPISPETLTQLRTDIQNQASESDLGRLVAPPVPSRVYFVYLIFRISNAVSELGPSESVRFEAYNGVSIPIRPRRALTADEADRLATESSETIDSTFCFQLKNQTSSETLDGNSFCLVMLLKQKCWIQNG